jgi:DNA modification methylase
MTHRQEWRLTEQLKAKGRGRRATLKDSPACALAAHVGRNDLRPELNLVERAPGDLAVPPRNVRAIDPAHVAEVGKAIAELGFDVPVLIDEANEVLDGVVRVEAAKLLGMTAIPCVVARHLSASQKRQLRLAANRLAEKGSWDLGALKIVFQELIVDDIALEVTGFTLDEVDQILLDDEPASVEVGPLEPEGTEAPVARLGAVFALGPHRIICGDARDPSVLAALMSGDEARLILTDEPYNVRIGGHVTKGGHREFAMASGEMSEADFAAFNAAWIKAALPSLVEGGVFGTFIDWRGYATVSAAALELGLHPLNLIVWSKTNAGMGSLYRSQHELLPLFKKGKLAHVNNVNLGKGGRWRSNVWQYPGASSMGSDARKGLRDHPTVKPTAMLEDALLDLTNRDDLVAAEKAGRQCRAVEIDPRYVDVAVRRWQTLTGRDAVLESTGQTFEEIVNQQPERGDRPAPSAPTGRSRGGL